MSDKIQSSNSNNIAINEQNCINLCTYINIDVEVTHLLALQTRSQAVPTHAILLSMDAAGAPYEAKIPLKPAQLPHAQMENKQLILHFTQVPVNRHYSCLLEHTSDSSTHNIAVFQNLLITTDMAAK